MALKKDFLKQRFSLKGSDKKVFLIGFLISILFSIAFFQFTSLIRELFRIVGFLQDGEYLLPFSESDRNFYNFFYAAISCVVGNAYFFEFYFNRPSVRLNGNLRKRISIITDQRNLTWFFIRWVTRLGTMYGFFFAWTFTDFSAARLHPDYDVVFILTIVVLYFSLWINFRLVYRQSFRLMIFGFAIFLLSSWLISNINFVDYQSLENSLLKNTVHYNLKIDLPRATQIKMIERRSLSLSFFIGYPQNGSMKPEIMTDYYLFQGKLIANDEIANVCKSFQSSLSEFERDQIQIALYCDKRVPIKVVNFFKHVLMLNGIRNIMYMTGSGSNALRSTKGLPILLRNYCKEIMDIYNAKENGLTFSCDKVIERWNDSNVIRIEIESNQIRINDIPLKYELVKNSLKDQFKRFKDKGVIFFKEDPNTLYETQLFVYDQIATAIDELRKEHATLNGFEYKGVGPWEPNYDAELKIRQLYSFYIVELSPEERIYFKDKFEKL